MAGTRVSKLQWRTGITPILMRLSHRRYSDLFLFGVTFAELGVLVLLTPSLLLVDWIYVLQHLIVLGAALTRDPPQVQDRTLLALFAVALSYAYPYAQVIYLARAPGDPAWPACGFILVALSACLSLASLVTLGRLFGIRPALRGLATKGPYRLVRHPMYLAYSLGDIGYNLEEWKLGTVLMVLFGWLALVYRIRAEERILFRDLRWPVYAGLVRYRLVPGIW